MTFTDYAVTKGLVLLSDDLRFIRGRLHDMPKEQIRVILKRYIEIWCDTMSSCENAIKRQNEGRRVANTYLREETNAKRNS